MRAFKCLTNGLANPERMRNLSICGAHDDHGSEVKHHVEDDGVGGAEPEVTEIFHTDHDDLEGYDRVLWLIFEKRFNTLDEELRADKGER